MTNIIHSKDQERSVDLNRAINLKIQDTLKYSTLMVGAGLTPFALIGLGLMCRAQTNPNSVPMSTEEVCDFIADDVTKKVCWLIELQLADYKSTLERTCKELNDANLKLSEAYESINKNQMVDDEQRQSLCRIDDMARDARLEMYDLTSDTDNLTKAQIKDRLMAVTETLRGISSSVDSVIG